MFCAPRVVFLPLYAQTAKLRQETLLYRAVGEKHQCPTTVAAGTEQSVVYPAGQPLQLCKATRVGCVGRTGMTGSTLAGLTLGTARDPSHR